MYYFDWDENKNRINLEKHGITFEEASTVFFDDRAILFDDPEHSIDEDRFLLLGMSENRKSLHSLSLLQRIRHSDQDYFRKAGNQEGGAEIC